MWFKYKYPKLTLLAVSIILAYILFKNPLVENFVLGLGDLSYLGVFIAGLLFPFGFTTAFAVGFFVTLNPENFILYGLVGAFGAMISNILIFSLIRFSFKKEFLCLERRLEKVKYVKEFEELVNMTFSRRIRHYLFYVIIGVIIASPLPDELGDIILAGMTKINVRILALITFILTFIGIAVLLLI